jgi:hypothetical protein
MKKTNYYEICKQKLNSTSQQNQVISSLKFLYKEMNNMINENERLILELQKEVLIFQKSLSKEQRKEFWNKIGYKTMNLDNLLSEETKKLVQPEPEYVSECCGVSPRGNGDSDSSDIGICPNCGDHCNYGYNSTDGEFFENLNDCLIKELENILNGN